MRDSPDNPDGSLPVRLAAVRERIARAAARSGRSPAAIRLVGISKTMPAGAIRAAAGAGLTDVGENRVQEALQKMAVLADLGVRWHLVGHLQSNKARRAAERFDVIHSIDSVEILRQVEAAAAAAGRTPALLIQADLAGEPTKHGVPEREIDSVLEAAQGLSAAQLTGLMLLPPFAEEAEAARPYFRRLRELRDRLARESGLPLPELSMGMSHDFEVAIEEGATMVRVGTAIFGERHRS